MDSEMDLETLASCSLVCRAFLRASQAEIFECLDASIDKESGKLPPFHRLHDILSQSPHLVRHIKNVRICIKTPIPMALVYVLDLLSNVQLFSLEQISWHPLSENARVAICELCRRSRLSFLKLERVRGLDLATLLQLANSPSLKELILLNVELSTTGDVNIQSHVRLNKFIFMASDIPVSWIAQGHSLSDLRHLHSTCDPGKLSLMQRVVDSATSLEEFSLFMMCKDHMPQHLSLATMTSLRSLSFYITSHTENFIPWLVQLIRSHNSPYLSEIHLEIHPTIGATVPTDWEKLTQLLEGPFAAVQTLQFNLWDLGAPPELLRPLVTAFMQAFSPLETRGVLVCTVDENNPDDEDDKLGELIATFSA
ncbi:hypothetical protein DFH06DRAFT_1203133 [Mycena polygramma]|nr:hypothetical protein DFH06DRAFT_1203133 [Mycena polygramma]